MSTFDTQPRAGLTGRPRKRSREKTRLEMWAWSPVSLLRVALFVKYLGFLYAGIIAILAGIPIFDLFNLPGYTTIWGSIVALSALTCTIGALSHTRRMEKVEMWGAAVLASFYAAYVFGLNIYAYGAGDIDRMFVGGIAFIAWVLPVARFAWLAAQTGKRTLNVSATDSAD